jgi:hypothetical protein
MNVAKLNWEDIHYVATHMRERDRREIFATMWGEDDEKLAYDLTWRIANSGEFGWVCGTTRPVAIVGALPVWPGVWNVFMFATDEFPAVALNLTKLIKMRMIPALKESGHKVFCWSHEGHTQAHKWLEFFGMYKEATVKHYGKNRETFYLYSYDV